MQDRNYVKYWAIIASAIALLLLGVLIGQKTSNKETFAEQSQTPVESMVGDRVLTVGRAGTVTGTANSEVSQDRFLIPEIFKGITGEWRTELAEDNLEGYAILFDPVRREVIVEQCHHEGYIDQGSGRAMEQGWEFCDNVLWASFTELDEQSATVTDRSGVVVKLELTLSGRPEEPVLALSFQDHSMLLIPGSKNDLLQAMESTPGIVKQKHLLFQLQEEQESEPRRNGAH